jgi:N5-(cytidine 5'-diphosphoramidyl)-L-glutamine hydrolase
LIRRLAISQRVIDNTSYPEKRDCLACDWANWSSAIFPDAALLPVPNLTGKVDSWWRSTAPDALILSGGNDWGQAPERDRTEQNLLEAARACGAPVLGVCRGLQAINFMFGGSVVEDLEHLAKDNHVGCDHTVNIISETVFRDLSGATSQTVNSYHNIGVSRDGIAKDLRVFAETNDGMVEGVYHVNEPILAIQWHPERNSPSADFDHALVTQLFSQGVFWQNLR